MPNKSKTFVKEFRPHCGPRPASKEDVREAECRIITAIKAAAKLSREEKLMFDSILSRVKHHTEVLEGIDSQQSR